MRATPHSLSILALGLLALLVSPPPSQGGEPGEVSFDVRMDAGDYGTGVSSDMQSAWLRFARGDRFRIRLDLPYLRVESSEGVARSFFGTVPVDKGQGRRAGAGTREEVVVVSEESTWESGLGDARLGTSARLFGGGVRVFRADAILDVKAPTADEDKGLGTGEWDLRAGIGTEYRFWSATGFAGAGFTRYGDPAWIELEDAADLYAGIESDPLGGRYVLSAWLEAQEEVVAGVGERSALGVGLRILGRTRYRVLATVGLSDAAEDFSIGLGVAFGTAGPGAGRRGSER